jgi:hypothetical protein
VAENGDVEGHETSYSRVITLAQNDVNPPANFTTNGSDQEMYGQSLNKLNLESPESATPARAPRSEGTV